MKSIVSLNHRWCFSLALQSGSSKTKETGRRKSSVKTAQWISSNSAAVSDRKKITDSTAKNEHVANSSGYNDCQEKTNRNYFVRTLSTTGEKDSRKSWTCPTMSCWSSSTVYRRIRSNPRHSNIWSKNKIESIHFQCPMKFFFRVAHVWKIKILMKNFNMFSLFDSQFRE